MELGLEVLVEDKVVVVEGLLLRVVLVDVGI